MGKEGEKYHITYSCTVLPQRILAVSLYEKLPGPDYGPFEYFVARRFAFEEKNLPALMNLIVLCSEEGNFNVNELMKDLTVVEQD